MVNINRFGMVRKEEVIETNLPVFSFIDLDNPFSEFSSEGSEYSCIDLCTSAQLKLLGIHLTDEQKQNIKGFVQMTGYRGWAPVYSLKEILSA